MFGTVVEVLAMGKQTLPDAYSGYYVRRVANLGKDFDASRMFVWILAQSILLTM